MTEGSLRGRRYLALLRTSSSQTEPSLPHPTTWVQKFDAKSGKKVGHENMKRNRKQGRRS